MAMTVTKTVRYKYTDYRRVLTCPNDVISFLEEYSEYVLCVLTAPN